jgi:hypothetical protein
MTAEGREGPRGPGRPGDVASLPRGALRGRQPSEGRGAVLGEVRAGEVAFVAEAGAVGSCGLPATPPSRIITLISS